MGLTVRKIWKTVEKNRCPTKKKVRGRNYNQNESYEANQSAYQRDMYTVIEGIARDRGMICTHQEGRKNRPATDLQEASCQGETQTPSHHKEIDYLKYQPAWKGHNSSYNRD